MGYVWETLIFVQLVYQDFKHNNQKERITYAYASRKYHLPVALGDSGHWLTWGHFTSNTIVDISSHDHGITNRWVERLYTYKISVFQKGDNSMDSNLLQLFFVAFMCRVEERNTSSKWPNILPWILWFATRRNKRWKVIWKDVFISSHKIYCHIAKPYGRRASPSVRNVF